MAREGYDVWLGNNRGTLFGKKHEHLDPFHDAKQFFDYSFFELGKYDAPAQIDYVLEKTNRPKLAYIGHSQGTSQMFSALSYDHGSLKNKISSFSSLAPIVILKHSPIALFEIAASIWQHLVRYMNNFGIYEITNPMDIKRFVCNIPFVG